MNGVFGVLDRHSASTDPQLRRLWVGDVERSLIRNPDAWLRQVGAPGTHGPPSGMGAPGTSGPPGGMGDAKARGTLPGSGATKDEAYALLGWVEQAASLAVAERRPDLIEAAVFAIALLEGGPLDRRDVMVPASLLRRGAVLIGADFAMLCSRACRRAGQLGLAAMEWLPKVSERTPATHEEVGEGASFEFRRRPAGFDPVALERKLTGKG